MLNDPCLTMSCNIAPQYVLQFSAPPACWYLNVFERFVKLKDIGRNRWSYTNYKMHPVAPIALKWVPAEGTAEVSGNPENQRCAACVARLLAGSWWNCMGLHGIVSKFFQGVNMGWHRVRAISLVVHSDVCSSGSSGFSMLCFTQENAKDTIAIEWKYDFKWL